MWEPRLRWGGCWCLDQYELQIREKSHKEKHAKDWKTVYESHRTFECVNMSVYACDLRVRVHPPVLVTLTQRSIRRGR